MKRLAAALVLLHCSPQVHPLDIADGCACREGQYCNVTAGRAECLALPASCGARPSCDCVGTPDDACRDYDGHLTLLPPRAVASCDACSGEELCIQGTNVAPVICRVVPARCEPTPTCDCILQSRAVATLACSEHHGRISLR